jgi:hypothetical protein
VKSHFCVAYLRAIAIIGRVSWHSDHIKGALDVAEEAIAYS